MLSGLQATQIMQSSVKCSGDGGGSSDIWWGGKGKGEKDEDKGGKWKKQKMS